MRHVLDEKQAAFFTKNGHLELALSHVTPPFDLTRDLWRKDKGLTDFLVKKVGPLALILSGKKRLCLACDQWFSKENRPVQAGPLKELFCIQGLCIAIAIAKDPVIP